VSNEFVSAADLSRQILILEQENKRFREALEFYSSRTIYERLSQFSGDEEYVECVDIANTALHGKD